MNLKLFGEYLRSLGLSAHGEDADKPEAAGLIVKQGDKVTTTPEGDRVCVHLLDLLTKGYPKYLQGVGARDDEPVQREQSVEFMKIVGSMGGLVPLEPGREMSRPVALISMATMLGASVFDEVLKYVRTAPGAKVGP